jgi:hypothetical protein
MTAWLLLNGGAVAAALALALALGAGAEAGLLGLAVLGGYLVLVHSLVLATGVAASLGVGELGGLLGVVLGATLWRARRRRLDPEETGATGPVTASTRFAAVAALLAAGVWAWPHLWHPTRLWIWDDYTYHMVYPALWLREHAIAAPAPAHAFTMQAWYPLSASVVAAWFMAPWPAARGDALAWVSLTGPLYAGLVATGAAALLARLGAPPGAWAVPVVLLATSPRIGVMASSFSDADLAVAATLFGAFALAVPRGADESAPELAADAGYAALLTGVALGVKASAGPVALVVLLLLVIRARALPRGRGRAAAGIAAGVGLAWAVTAGYWYARNALHTGNPVYPAAFLGWPGTTFPETTLLEYARHYGVRRTVGDALAVYADWPRAYAVLAALGLAGLAGRLALARGALSRPQRYHALGTLAIAATTLALLPVAPFSAGNAMTFRSGFVHWDSMRYVALLPILGWVALGALVHGRTPRGGSLALAVIAAAALLTAGFAPLAVVALAVGAAVFTRRRRGAAVWPRATPRGRAVAVAGVALAVMAIVAGRHGAKAAATAAAFQAEPLLGAVVAVLDDQPPGTRVAVFGDQWIYPAFGARHHLRPIRLDGDGRPLASNLIGDAMAPGDLTVDPATFRSNLGAAGVEVVVVVHLPHPGRSPAWPAQAAALDDTPDARLLHRDGATAVWRLGSPRAPPSCALTPPGAW